MDGLAAHARSASPGFRNQQLPYYCSRNNLGGVLPKTFLHEARGRTECDPPKAQPTVFVFAREGRSPCVRLGFRQQALDTQQAARAFP